MDGGSILVGGERGETVGSSGLVVLLLSAGTPEDGGSGTEETGGVTVDIESQQALNQRALGLHTVTAKDRDPGRQGWDEPRAPDKQLETTSSAP